MSGACITPPFDGRLATYPEDGYSYAMVLDVGRDREQFLTDVIPDIVTKTVHRAMKGSPA